MTAWHTDLSKRNMYRNSRSFMPARKPRRVYDASFKLAVVEQALKLPPDNRIKPTCRAYPGVEPVRRSSLASQHA